MTDIPMSREILVGISACVLGEKVRFDGGHKKHAYATTSLASYFHFTPVCPEVGAGLPVPRPAIRLISDGDRIRLVETKNADNDVTESVVRFSERQVASLQTMPLCGFIVCSKSPTCGMERVKVYKTDQAEKTGVGLFTRHLMEQMPWLPVEEDGRMNDPVLRENFVARVFCLHDFYQSVSSSPQPREIIDFHSRYKLTLMAHHPDSYKKLGQLVARVADYEPAAFFDAYRLALMEAIRRRATRKNNVNVLLHIQGYFKTQLDKTQKQNFTQVIHDYRKGSLPLLAPLTLIQHYLTLFPNAYLQQQQFLQPYPKELGLRYGI